MTRLVLSLILIVVIVVLFLLIPDQQVSAYPAPTKPPPTVEPYPPPNWENTPITPRLFYHKIIRYLGLRW